MKRILTNPLVLAGLILTSILGLLALFAPWVAPYSPAEINLIDQLLPPSTMHLLGTDSLGRDVFSRMVYGARVSLLVGFVAVGIATLVGVVCGAFAGFYGGWVDRLLMRFVDVMLAFPAFFLILAVIAFLDPSIINIMVVIGLTSWMGTARLVRAEFLRLKTLDYVAAARLAGTTDINIMLRHLLPNALAPVLVTATLGIAGAVLVESGLSFLGIGVQPPTPSWGNILLEGKANIEIAWWLSLFPGLAILLAVLGFNLLGEGLRDALDPRLR
ncbi:MAG: ABC transporter permease [Alphaproteobacteria bacterium]|nr:ABC transporter permease [Alphaproteobacteria bacterium]MDD9920500.1 ABC transporter permease [Alphaproteobacteria bacterium]